MDEDRILGVVFGCALGDALGLPAEGGDKEILAQRYPEGMSLPHKTPCRGFPLNDWTDDTDQTVLMMRSLAAHGEEPSAALARDFAKRLADWMNNGFSELGDTYGNGCGNMTGRVLRRGDFLTDPHGAARAIVGPRAGNGALMRTAPCAFTRDPAAYAAHMCTVTHADPYCVATCVAQCALVRSLAGSAKVDPEMLREAMILGVTNLTPQQRASVMDWAMRSRDLGLLELGGRDARGYTLQSFACSLWAFRALARHRAAPATDDAAFFKTTLRRIVAEGGDADTNAAIAGALLGAALGYSRLPADWIETMPNRDWLTAEVKKFTAALNE